MVARDVQALGVARRPRRPEGRVLGGEGVDDVVASDHLPGTDVGAPDLLEVASDIVLLRGTRGGAGGGAAARQQAGRGDEVASGGSVGGHGVGHHDRVHHGPAAPPVDGEQR